MRVLRNNEDTLMTVLETFLHDPAVDMVKKVSLNYIETKLTPQVRKSSWINSYNVRYSRELTGEQKKLGSKVPDTPKAVLETIQNKLRGLFQGETVPLSVEGQVHELLRTAVSPQNLCSM